MTNLVKPWLIKVLNGPNAGAQILVSGEVTVGTSVDCDLILNDPHICAVHCQIRKSEAEEFEIIPKDGIAFINGKRIEDPIGKLKLGEVLTLGSTHLTGGPSEQLWPPVTIPVIQEVRAEAEPVTAVTAALPPSTTTIPKKKQLPISQEALKKIIIIGLLLFVGFALMRILVRRNLVVSRSEFKPSNMLKPEMLLADSEKKGSEVLARIIEKKLPKVYIKTMHIDNQDVLYIYTHDQVEYDDVRKVMNSHPVPVVANIINIDEIDDSGLAMMQALNLSVSVSVDDHGKAIWTGYVPNEKLLESMKEQIARDIPAITDNEYHIVLGEEATQVALSILIKNRFNTVSVMPERNNLVLTGSVFEGDQNRWQTTLQELATAFESKVKLANMVTINPTPVKERSFFNAPVVSVSISSVPYAVLRNGERIFLGARVRDGYTVDSITTKGIGLSNDAGTRIIPVAGE